MVSVKDIVERRKRVDSCSMLCQFAYVLALLNRKLYDGMQGTYGASALSEVGASLRQKQKPRHKDEGELGIRQRRRFCTLPSLRERAPLCGANANQRTCRASALSEVGASPTTEKSLVFRRGSVVGEAGFGPAKSVTTDLQSAPFGRSGIPPDIWSW